MMQRENWQDEAAQMLAFATRLADAAGAAALPFFRATPETHNKAKTGFDPVTEADRQAELAMRALIEEKFSDHGIVGEELGVKPPRSAWTWVLDPIDGTRSFISGTPTWMTLIALMHEGTPVAGVAAQPFTREMFVAGPHGAFLQTDGTTRPLKTLEESQLSRVLAGTTGPRLYEARGKHQQLAAMQDATRHLRYDADAYFYCMVAAGVLGVAMDTGLNSYDIAALVPIVENSGGVVTNWTGGDAAQGGDVVASANARLHEQVLRILSRQ